MFRNVSRWRKPAARTTINFDEKSVIERLNDLTDGKGPEKCIDAVGNGKPRRRLHAVHDKVKQTLMWRRTGRTSSAKMMMCAPPSSTIPQPSTHVVFVGAALLSLSSAIVVYLGLVGPVDTVVMVAVLGRGPSPDALVTAAGR